MQYSIMEQFWIWLASVESIGPQRFYRLLSEYEDARTVWDLLANGVPDELRFLGSSATQNLWAARNEAYFYRLFDLLERTGTRAVTRVSDGYPARLTHIYDPPPVLYQRGECPLDADRMLAIVGARSCTRDGRRAAQEFARELAEQDVTIVSGMAWGIDTAAHRGALEAGGRTIAVLGSGPDVAYPADNADLMQQILDSGGCVLSEYLPGTQPLSGHFPARNRIISGLCRGVLLVEGAEKSGASITVRHAVEQDRDVFAIPGGIYSPKSALPNQLLQQGAILALRPGDILEHYRWGGAAAPARNVSAPPPELSPEEAAVVAPLRNEACSFDELVTHTGFSAAKLNSLLTMMELRGIIMRVPDGTYRAYL